MKRRDLPTREDMLRNAQAQLSVAYKALGDAADWLRSDWRPIDTSLTKEQAEHRKRMFEAIDRAKAEINRAR